MGDLLRALNDNGINVFRDYLAKVRARSSEEPPYDILFDAYFSAIVQTGLEMERRGFGSRLIAGSYIYGRLQSLYYSKVERNVGLWSWLALYYFDEVCPIRAKGIRKVGEDSRYVLELDYRRYYRHLLLGPYMVYRLYEASVPLLLWEPLDRMGVAYRELSCRQNLLANRGIVEAANVLYFDQKRGRIKRGAGVKTPRAGSLSRFIDVVQQLELTYDLYSMTGEQILELLPSEFDEWRGQESKKGKEPEGGRRSREPDPDRARESADT